MATKKTAVVLNSCNEWKEYASFQLVGVYTNRKELNKMLNKMLKDKEIELQSNDSIEDLSVTELHSQIEYASLQEVTLNEEC